MKPDHRNRRTQDIHFFNEDGMVACNPRDREAAHRGEVEGIASDNPDEVTCKKCREAMQFAGVLRSGKR